MDVWHDFLVSQAGASAALLGLLFVSLSINIERILAFPSLAERGLLALMLLLAVLLSASLALIPAQYPHLFGGEILVIGAILALAGGVIQWRAYSVNVAHRANIAVNTVFFVFAVLPYVVAGWLLMTGAADALYWIAAAMIMSFVKVVIDAWVLLVEIKR